MNQPTPRTIAEYLEQLRSALHGADAALIQDALFDAEDHLRSEFAEHPGESEAAILAKMATSYGAPDEVAEIYRDQEIVIERALRTPRPRQRSSWLARFFSVIADPRAWSAMFYMLLALPTGIFYFVWAVVGSSLSLSLMILVIGLPLATLFLATVRVLSLVEGRIIEVMLGERMPRRPVYASRNQTFMARVKGMFADPRTWTTLFYMIIRLPLGILYFVTLIVGIAVPLALIANPVVYQFSDIGMLNYDGVVYNLPIWLQPVQMLVGVVALFGMMHLARGVARFQGALAKHLLVQSGS
ncbi:MAG: sensor domain-containing protein [Tahibacter sp.]